MQPEPFQNGPRPVMYVDWRALWQDANAAVGSIVSWQFRRDGKITMTRHLYAALHRERRLWERMEVESEVKDKTWCMALIDLIQRECPE